MAAFQRPLVAHVGYAPSHRGCLARLGTDSRVSKIWLPNRGLSYQSSSPGLSVRKKMVPLIKMVHPDLFAQYPPDVAKTNQKSLKVRFR